jgi:hypothetical protein
MESLEWTICREFSFSELLRKNEKRELTFTDYFPSSTDPNKGAALENSNAQNTEPSSNEQFADLRLDDTKPSSAEIVLTDRNCQSYTGVVSRETLTPPANASEDVSVRPPEELPSVTGAVLQNRDGGAEPIYIRRSGALGSSVWFVIWIQTVLFFLAAILVLCFTLKH